MTKPLPDKKVSLEEIFKDWVWTAKTASIVVGEKPTYVIFEKDLPRFKQAIKALVPEKINNYTGTDMEDWQKGFNACLDQIKQRMEKE